MLGHLVTGLQFGSIQVLHEIEVAQLAEHQPPVERVRNTLLRGRRVQHLLVEIVQGQQAPGGLRVQFQQQRLALPAQVLQRGAQAQVGVGGLTRSVETEVIVIARIQVLHFPGLAVGAKQLPQYGNLALTVEALVYPHQVQGALVQAP